MKYIKLLLCAAGVVCIGFTPAYSQSWHWEEVADGFCMYPAIDVDNMIIQSGGGSFGRPHVVWTAKGTDSQTEALVWRTCYNFKNDTGSWLETPVEVDREKIDAENSLYWYSDTPSRPYIVVDPDDDMADIVFHQLKPDWYYVESPPANPVSEILFAWKIRQQNLDIDPPDYLHHLSGLQKDIQDPFILYMGFQPHQIYRDAVFWSRLDGKTGNKSVYYNYQAGAKNSARSHIDWGEQTRSSDSEKVTGVNPFADVAIDRTGDDPEEHDQYMMAVVSLMENSAGTAPSAVCSICKIPGMNTEHVWKTMDIPGATGETVSCAFDYPADPHSEPPNLHVVYRKKISGTQYQYAHRELFNTWTENPYFSGEEYIGSARPDCAARAVIRYDEGNTRHIAFINEDGYLFYKKDSDNPVCIVGANVEDPSDVRWVDMAVDTAGLPEGYRPHVVFDGEFTESTTAKRHIFYAGYY
jgi:hypothetical protein